MIIQLFDFPSDVVAFVCKGRVTKADYDLVLVPAVTKALSTHDKLRLYYETAADFAGVDAGAAWRISRLEWSISRAGNGLPS